MSFPEGAPEHREVDNNDTVDTVCCRCCCTSTKNNVTTTAPNITTTSTTDDNDNGDILKYILHYCLNDVTVGALMGFKLLRSDVWYNAIGW